LLKKSRLILEGAGSRARKPQSRISCFGESDSGKGESTDQLGWERRLLHCRNSSFGKKEGDFSFARREKEVEIRGSQKKNARTQKAEKRGIKRKGRGLSGA